MIILNPETKDLTIYQGKTLAENYAKEGFHCAEAIIRACVVALELDISEDFIVSACGFRGGGGGYHDRCGVFEVGIMLISLIYGRKEVGEEVWTYSYLIRELHERFLESFNSIYCKDILFPLKELNNENPCLPTYIKGTEIILELLFEANGLLNLVSEEEKEI